MSEEPSADRPWHRGLTRTAIAEAALDIGLDQLTIASLAERLEVTQAALYRHFSSRDAIVGAAIDLLASRIDWPGADADWQEHLRHIGVTLLDAYAANPGLVAAVNRLGPPPTIESQINESALALTRAGFSHEDAMLALTMLNSLVDGVAGSADPAHPPVLEHVDHEHRRAVPFSAQLDTLIAGLTTRLTESGPGGP